MRSSTDNVTEFWLLEELLLLFSYAVKISSASTILTVTCFTEL